VHRQRGLAAAAEGRDHHDPLVREQAVEFAEFGEAAGEVQVRDRQLVEPGNGSRSAGRSRRGSRGSVVGDQREQLPGVLGGQLERGRDQPDRLGPRLGDTTGFQVA
jgi:hypothetical protein